MEPEKGKKKNMAGKKKMSDEKKWLRLECFLVFRFPSLSVTISLTHRYLISLPIFPNIRVSSYNLNPKENMTAKEEV